MIYEKFVHSLIKKSKKKKYNIFFLNNILALIKI